MATALSRLREPPEDPAAALRLWRLAAIVALVLWAAYLLVPDDALVLRHIVIYPGADLAATAAVFYGVHVYRPRASAAWRLIGAGLACFSVADLIYGIQQVTGHQPFPSVADVFYLAAYPLFIVGLQTAGRARGGQAWGNLLDAALIAVPVGLAAGLVIAHQYVDDPEIALGATIVASAYPVADVLLLAVALRYLLGASWRAPALGMFAAGIGLTLLGDIAYTAGELFTSDGDASSADALLLAGTLAIGLAALHPSMTELTAEPEKVTDELAGVPRVVGIYLVSLVPTVILGVQAVVADVHHVWITLVALGIVAVLVVLRVTDLVRMAHRAAAREATLSRLGEQLLGSRADRPALVAAAERAACEVLRDHAARVVEVDGDPGEQPKTFRARVEVEGRVVAVIETDQRHARLPGTRDALRSAAHLLALALERHDLLEAQRAAADQLVHQNAQLRDLDRMKDQLVGSVSHELRTPLTSIGGYAEMLISEEYGELNEEQLLFAQVIERNSKRLNRLIDDILFVSRADAGGLTLDCTWTDLAELAAACVTSARPRAGQGRVTIELAVDADLPPVWADPVRLTQLFDNLISNAVKFTPPGGTIWVGITASADLVHLEVADTGMGIPPDELDRLFERFFRTSTVGAVAGTGLGLSIVKSIVEVHGGTITVSSTEGVGTTFRVELPVRPRPGDGRSEPAVPAASESTG